MNPLTPAERLEVLIGAELTHLPPAVAERQARSLIAMVMDFIDRNADDLAVLAGIESVDSIHRLTRTLRSKVHSCRHCACDNPHPWHDDGTGHVAVEYGSVR